MATYNVTEESGASNIVEADSLEEAMNLAEEWVQGGSYPDDYKGYVPFVVRDEDGNEECGKALVGHDPEPPECTEGYEHEWESPHEVVGGDRHNPGVWGGSGTQLHFTEVCKWCGTYKNTKTESTPGQLPNEPRRVKYKEASDTSKEWAKGNRRTASREKMALVYRDLKVLATIELASWDTEFGGLYWSNGGIWCVDEKENFWDTETPCKEEDAAEVIAKHWEGEDWDLIWLG